MKLQLVAVTEFIQTQIKTMNTRLELFQIWYETSGKYLDKKNLYFVRS